jgi:tetratricopeptide (TPR) repeat protein
MADRYSYVPSIGFLIAVVWGLYELIAAIAGRRAKFAGGAAAGIVVLLFSVLARAQVGYWESTYAIYAHAVEVTDDNWLAEYNLGLHEEKLGHYQKATAKFEYAMGQNPRFASAYVEYGNCVAIMSPNKALAYYDKALELNPRDSLAFINRGAARLAMKDAAGAVEDIKMAVQLAPDNDFFQTELAKAEKALKH